MSEPPRERALDEVGRLLAGQAKLRAIALYREATGAGHADAKRAIERIQAGQPPADPRPACRR